MRRVRTFFAAGVAAALAIGGSLLITMPTDAADHNEPGSVVNNGVALNKALDIADIYAWHTADKVMMVYSFAGPGRDTASIGTYDRDGLYTLNISTDSDPLTPEVTIEMRYGRDAAGNWGVQLKGVPGATGTIEGPIQKVLTSGSAKVEAGVFDDPFFFDSMGFTYTKNAGDLRFCNNTNTSTSEPRTVPPASTDPRLQPNLPHCDTFFGTNDTMLILELPRSALDKGFPLNIWVRAARLKPGIS